MPYIDLGRVVGPAGPQGATGPQGPQGVQGPSGPNQITTNTSTPLSGVLTGKNGLVAATAVDSAPTSGSSNLISSGGVYNALQHRPILIGKSTGTGTTASFDIPSTVNAFIVYGTAYNATRVFGAIIGRQGDTCNVFNLATQTISATISDNVMTITAPATYAYVYVLIYQ